MTASITKTASRRSDRLIRGPSDMTPNHSRGGRPAPDGEARVYYMDIFLLFWTSNYAMIWTCPLIGAIAMMNDMDHSPRRAASGRFLPGQSANPAGKKPGTRNRAAILSDMLSDGEAGTLARILNKQPTAGEALAPAF